MIKIDEVVQRPAAGTISEGTPSGRREVGKEERRQRIIQAARAMIRETGSTGLSMRALAERAGVSLATPYNLFGSKGAIVLAVLQDVRTFQARFSQVRSTDPFDRIFAAVALAVEYYLADPPFYKTLWREVFNTTSDVRSAIYNPVRREFWAKLIRGAAVAGAIAPGIDVEFLLDHLDHQFRSVMLDWVSGDLAPEALEPAVCLGYALILTGAAAPDWRDPLRLRLIESQARLVEAGGRDRRSSVLPS